MSIEQGVLVAATDNDARGRRGWLRIFGYVAFAVVMLLWCVYWTFPYGAVGSRLADVLRAQTGGALTLTFGDLSGFRLSGVDARAVTIKLSRPGKEPLQVPIDRLTVRAQLAPLLWLSPRVGFGVQAGAGEIHGVMSLRGAERRLEADIEKLDLSVPNVLQQLTDLPVRGQLSGNVEGTWPLSATSDGHVELALQGLALGSGSVSGFTIPEVQLGDVDTVVRVEQGNMTLATFKQKGGQLALRMTGSGKVRKSAVDSTMDVCLEFKADEKFLSDNPKVRAALQLAEVQLRKDQDGYYHVPLSGTWKNPRLRRGLCRRTAPGVAEPRPPPMPEE